MHEFWEFLAFIIVGENVYFNRQIDKFLFNGKISDQKNKYSIH